MLNLSGIHTFHHIIIQTKKSATHALLIDTLSGSKFFDTARHVALTLIPFDKPADMCFGSVKEGSDASRLLSLESFLCDVCSFLLA